MIVIRAVNNSAVNADVALIIYVYMNNVSNVLLRYKHTIMYFFICVHNMSTCVVHLFHKFFNVTPYNASNIVSVFNEMTLDVS